MINGLESYKYVRVSVKAMVIPSKHEQSYYKDIYSFHDD